MSIRDRLKKAAGLFVEFDGSEQGDPNLAAPIVQPAKTQTKTVEEIVRDSPGPNLADIQATHVEQRPVFGADGGVDFQAIYQMASLTPTPFGAEQVIQILSEFPPELSIEAKRATMKVTLGAMTSTTGASSETVVADASRKMAALASYCEGFEKQANEFIERSQAEILRLQEQIEKNKTSIENAKSKAAAVTQACVKESDRLDDVLEFFSLDVAPSKYAKP